MLFVIGSAVCAPPREGRRRARHWPVMSARHNAVPARTHQVTTSDSPAPTGVRRTSPLRTWSWRTTHPSGTVTPTSARRATAFAPVGCMSPTVIPSASRRSRFGGMIVAIVTGGARFPKKANRPAGGSTSTASSSIPGWRLTQPLPAARSSESARATPTTSGGVNSNVFVSRRLLTCAILTPAAPPPRRPAAPRPGGRPSRRRGSCAVCRRPVPRRPVPGGWRC